MYHNPNPNRNLDLWPFNPKTMSFLEYPKVIPFTKFEHIRIIRLWVMMRTNRRTDGLERPTHADRQSQRG